MAILIWNQKMKVKKNNSIKNKLTSLNKWATRTLQFWIILMKDAIFAYRECRLVHSLCAEAHVGHCAFLNPECLTTPAFSRPISLRLL